MGETHIESYSKFSANTKIINSIRKAEDFYFSIFYSIQNIKTKLFTEDDDNWERLAEFILNTQNDDISFVLKEGFRLNVDKIKEIVEDAEFDKKKRKELFKYFYFPNEVLLSLIKNEYYGYFKNLKEEENFIINNIICMHYPLIVKIISKPVKKQPFLSNYFYELFNEGVIGMITALHKFNDTKGAKFSTYAYKWVLYFVNKYIDSMIKEIDLYNGKFNKHLFKSGTLLKKGKTYDDLKKDFENAELDLISLFDKINFDLENEKVHAAFNSLMNNSSLRNKLLNNARKINSQEMKEVLSLTIDDKIKARKVLETLYPSVEVFRISEYEHNGINKKEEVNTLTIDGIAENQIMYNRDIIEKVMEHAELEENEKEVIYEFLENEEFNHKVNSIIKKIRKSIKGKEHFFE